MDKKQLVKEFRDEQYEIMKDCPHGYTDYVRRNQKRLEAEYKKVVEKKEKELAVAKERLLNKLFDSSEVKALPHGREIFDMLMSRAETENKQGTVEDIVDRYLVLEEVAMSAINLDKKGA
jgi:hypothetical protein